MKKRTIPRFAFPFLIATLSLYATSLYSQDKPVITVLDFETNDIAEGDMKLIISLITSHLFQTEQYTVIDIAQRETILEEMKFSLSGCADESCQIEIGKLLAAELIVVGSVGKVGNKYVLSIRTLDVSTSKTVNTADGVYADIDELVEALEPLVLRLAGIEGAGATAGGPARRPGAGRRLAAVSTLGTGTIVGAAGGVLLYLAFQYLQGPVEDAWLAYDTATAADDIDGLYATYLDEFGVFRTRLIIGAAGVGGSLLFIGTSIALFRNPQESNDEAALAFGVYPTVRGVVFQARISR